MFHIYSANPEVSQISPKIIYFHQMSSLETAFVNLETILPSRTPPLSQKGKYVVPFRGNNNNDNGQHFILRQTWIRIALPFDISVNEHNVVWSICIVMFVV